MDRWEAFCQIEPWGQPADDARAGQMAAAICAAQGMPLSPEVIATGIRTPEKEQSVAEQQALLRQQAEIHRQNQGPYSSEQE